MPNITEYCSICTASLDVVPPYSESQASSECPLDIKATLQDRRVPCCGRAICSKCIQKNKRFATYCPYCQVSNSPSLLPQGLKDPPLYTSLPPSHTRSLAPPSSSHDPPLPPPPPYDADPSAPQSKSTSTQSEKASPAAEDTLHFLDHNHDTVHSLSLRYRVPADAIRRRNNIPTDYLLLARKTVQIPGEFYQGESLSARPLEGEDEERTRRVVGRFMRDCKVHDYDVALLYLEQAAYDLEGAVAAYRDDEAWEREHPQHKRAEGERRRQKRTSLSGGLDSTPSS